MMKILYFLCLLFLGANLYFTIEYIMNPTRYILLFNVFALFLMIYTVIKHHRVVFKD